MVASCRVFLPLALAACTPAPASSEEILLTVQEMIVQGRAMAIENDVVGLVANVDPDGDPAALRDTVAAAIAGNVACAAATPREPPGELHVVFADGCTVHGRALAGSLTATYDRPVDELRVTVSLQLTRDGTTVSGNTQIAWAADGTQRVVGDLRLDIPAPDPDMPDRQLVVQSDRIQRAYRGLRQVDGWQRWQAQPGKWRAELAGWELASDTLLPFRGLTVVDTPYEHDVILDHRDLGDGSIELRANGGRVDRVFVVDADGTITDLGDD